MKSSTIKDAEKRFKRLTTIICDTLEIVIAAIVIIGILIAISSLFPGLVQLAQNKGTENFFHFLEQIFTVVIGIEFLKMLCRPNSDNVMETLIFLVARHMIINSTTPLEDLLSTISIVILCLVRRYLKSTRVKSTKDDTEEFAEDDAEE